MHSPNLLIIDALNLIRRIYAVEEKQHSSDVALITACKARVFNATQRMLKMSTFHYGCAVLDGRNSWRYHFYPAYKAHRQPMPTLLNEHLTEVCKGFEQAGLFVYVPTDDEADDVIATLAIKAHNAGLHNIIASTDKGFLPLLSSATDIFDYFQQIFVTDAAITEKYQVTKTQFIDYLALVGDKTNNIPGVKGVGKQSAIELLAKFNTVDEALAVGDDTLKAKNKIIKDIDNFIISRALLTLRTDIPLGINLKNIRISQALVAER